MRYLIAAAALGLALLLHRWCCRWLGLVLLLGLDPGLDLLLHKVPWLFIDFA